MSADARVSWRHPFFPLPMVFCISRMMSSRIASSSSWDFAHRILAAIRAFVVRCSCVIEALANRAIAIACGFLVFMGAEYYAHGGIVCDA
jgi:hypothetical protein